MFISAIPWIAVSANDVPIASNMRSVKRAIAPGDHSDGSRHMSDRTVRRFQLSARTKSEKKRYH
jgi:hypothetical protein